MRLTVDVAFRDEFKESEHPRGQPENAGEFAPAGGASSGSKAGSLTGRAITKEGKRVQHNGEPLPSHIQALRIPPAWTDVQFSHDPHAALQATGKDVKGRRQSVYSAKFSESQAAMKFARIKELGAKFDAIVDQNNELRKSPDAKTRDNADCTHLIMLTGIRPGSNTETFAKVKAYGASTLEGKHVVVGKDGVSLQFTGKKGVALNIPVRDPEMAEMLKSRKAAAGNDGPLFGSVSDKTLLAHVHTLDGGNFKTKDFRTALGTKTAVREVERMPVPTDAKSYKKAVMDVAKVVSTRLGNTPTVALQSYISPVVFAKWQGAMTV